MVRLLVTTVLATLLASGCAIDTFKTAPAGQGRPQDHAGSGPVLKSPPVITPPAAGAEPVIAAPAPTPLPRERPKAPPATLSPASKALVSQADAQRRKGDLPGATATLERALHIEPNNPLLWIELGRLRMDQQNYPQAEAMGRKALAMSVGDDRTQSQAWRLISDALRARGQNVQAQEAAAKAKALSPQ